MNHSSLFFLAVFFIYGHMLLGAPEGDVVLPTYLRPIQEVKLSSSQNGIIKEISVKQGDSVKKGEVLFSLNSGVVEAQMAQSQAQAEQRGRLESAEAELEIATERLKIIEGLNERGTSNSAELRKARLTAKVASGTVKAAKEELAVLKIQVTKIEAELDELTIRSPISGVIAEINREIGESTSQAGSKEDGYILKVIDLSRLLAKAHVPYLRAENLNIGKELVISLEDSLKTEARGKIGYISPTVDAATGLTEVHVIFDNEKGSLKAGIPAKLTISAQK